jgi:hypothetical protein
MAMAMLMAMVVVVVVIVVRVEEKRGKESIESKVGPRGGCFE